MSVKQCLSQPVDRVAEKATNIGAIWDQKDAAGPVKHLYLITDFDLHLATSFGNYPTTCCLKISVVCKARE